MAQRKLIVDAGFHATRRIPRSAGAFAVPVPSPARALHDTLALQFAVPARAPIPILQRLGLISLLASLCWSFVGSGTYLILH